MAVNFANMERRRFNIVSSVLAFRSINVHNLVNIQNSFQNDSAYVNMLANRRECVPRVRKYVESTVLRYEPTDFKSHFRVERSTFELLLEQLGPCPELSPRQVPGNPCIDPQKYVMVFLWYVGK